MVLMMMPADNVEITMVAVMVVAVAAAYRVIVVVVIVAMADRAAIGANMIVDMFAINDLPLFALAARPIGFDARPMGFSTGEDRLCAAAVTG